MGDSARCNRVRKAEGAAPLTKMTWARHSDLIDRTNRSAYTEAALKHGERPATAIATTTLELGIDIGAVKSVAQIGPAPSVASLRQRLGRSGRRRGEAAILRSYCIESEFDPHAPLSDRLREGLVQTVAQINLLTRGWFEPPRTEGIDASTLVQQLLSLVAQYGGVTAAQAWQVLAGEGVFSNVERSDFLELLRGLGRREILQQDEEGLLLPAPNGERLINHYSFLAAFQSDEEFRVVVGGRPLGSLPISRPLDEGSYVIFAGRRWRVVTCNQTDKVIEVVPARGGKVPTFDGMAGRVHDAVRAEMRSILESDAMPAFLDSSAKAMLIEARDSYRSANLGHDRIQQVGRGVYVFTWRGDCANETLALILAHRGLRAQNDGLAIEVEDSRVERVLAALHEIANDPPPDALALASTVENRWRRKWDWVLPERLLSASYASGELDVPGAVEAAGDLLRGTRTAV